MESYTEAYYLDKVEYPRLAELKGEKKMQELLKMHSRLEIDSELLKELHGQDLILIMGATGSGKSTFANSLLSGVDSIEWFEDYSGLKTTQPLKYNNRSVFEIGTEVTGCTQTPGFIPKGGAYFVDCPGFDDSNPYNEYPNQTLITHMIQNAKSVQIVLTFTGSMLDAKRGKDFFKLITTISRIISDKGLDNLDKFLMPLLLQPLSVFPRNLAEISKWGKFIDKKLGYFSYFSDN
jgi:hypothetical protein